MSKKPEEAYVACFSLFLIAIHLLRWLALYQLCERTWTYLVLNI